MKHHAMETSHVCLILSGNIGNPDAAQRMDAGEAELSRLFEAADSVCDQRGQKLELVVFDKEVGSGKPLI
ncbi:MAG: hypothetical protein AB2605_19200 [Candidatus Thiodiazotropha sp.]